MAYVTTCSMHPWIGWGSRGAEQGFTQEPLWTAAIRLVWTFDQVEVGFVP